MSSLDIGVVNREVPFCRVYSKEAKEKLFKQKESDWLKFGYKQSYLDEMRHPEFWEKEYNKVFEYDKKIKEMRGKEIK